MLPAIEWNSDWNGPTATWDRKPLVGDPPWIQAPADGVEYPRPKSLSRNAHRKMKPVAIRRTAIQRAPARLGCWSVAGVVSRAVEREADVGVVVIAAPQIVPT